MIRDAVIGEVEDKIKQMVDGMIDMELVNLRLAFKAKKKKYPKEKKKKKKKKKKVQVPGAKANRNRDPRDMLAELVEAGIVKKLLPTTLQELKGEPHPLRSK